MSRRSRFPLDPKGREVQFYRGDWDRLTEILAPRKIKPGTFIREMVSKVIRNAEESVNTAAQKIPEVDLEIEQDD